MRSAAGAASLEDRRACVEVKHGDKPVALFNFLIRQYKEEQKRIADQ